jgi:hypothetical protein
MTAVPDFHVFDAPRARGWLRRDRPVATMTETYWGYRIDGRQAPVWMIGLQWLCWIVGVILVVAAVGIWAVPGSSGLLAFKLGASVPLGAVAALLLWHSSGGTVMGIEVDLRLGEVREVLSNRAGRTTVLSRWGFDAIGGVYIDPVAGRPGVAELVLGYRDASQVLRVAKGPEVALVGLGERLGRDLMVGRRSDGAEAVAEAAKVAIAA